MQGFCEKKFKNSFFSKKGVKTEDFQDDIQKNSPFAGAKRLSICLFF